MRRFDEHSIQVAAREGWTRVRIDAAGRYGPTTDWDDSALLCVELDDVVDRVRALVAIPGLHHVEFVLSELPVDALIPCLELLSTVPELVLRVLGADQVRALAALSNAAEVHLRQGRTDNDRWIEAQEGAWPILARLPGLRRLGVSCGRIDARDLARLGDLQELEVDGVELSNLHALGGLALRRFTGWGLANAPAIVAELATMGSMVDLKLVECGLQDDILPIIAQASGIEVLCLPGNQLHGATLGALADLPLHTLDLSGNPVGASLDHLTRLSSLRVLDLRSVELGGQRCEALAGLEGLVELNLGGCKVGQAAAPVIGQLQALQVLRVDDCDLVDVGFVSGLRQLRVLDLENNRKLNNLFARDLLGLRELRTLGIRYNFRLGVSVTSALSELPHLEALTMIACNLAPDHIRALAHSSSLRRLDMSGCDLGDLGMRALAPLSELTLLDVARCRVGDAGAAALADSLPKLRCLDLDGNHLTNRGAAAIMRLDRLLWLNLGSNDIDRTDWDLPGAQVQIDGQHDGPPAKARRPCFLTEVNELLEQAFDGVPVPEPPSRTLYQAQAEDNHERCDRSRDHLGRWQDLPDDHLSDCTNALSYLDAHGIRYYLPAMLRVELLRVLEPTGRDDLYLDDPVFHLTPDPTDAHRDYTRGRMSLLDLRQRAAIAAWVAATQEDVDIREPWRRVAQHDATGAPGDWFDVFWPVESHIGDHARAE